MFFYYLKPFYHGIKSRHEVFFKIVKKKTISGSRMRLSEDNEHRVIETAYHK